MANHPKFPGVYPRVQQALLGVGPDGNPPSAGAKVVSNDLIAQAKTANPSCRCMERGDISVGMDLQRLKKSRGCRDPLYVCPCLDKLRRLMAN